MISKVLCFFLLINITLALFSSDDNVAKLTESNFDSEVKLSTNVTIVLFYADWCGYCKKFAPIFKETAETLSGEIKLGAVDCDLQINLCDLYEIKSVPTILIFSGEEYEFYSGERTVNAIVEAARAAAQEYKNHQSQSESTTNPIYDQETTFETGFELYDETNDDSTYPESVTTLASSVSAVVPFAN